MNPSPTASQLWLGRALVAVGIALVTYTLLRLVHSPGLPLGVVIAMVASLAAWVVLTFIRRSTPLAIGLLVVMIGGGAISAPATNGLGIAAAAVGVLWLARDPEIPFALAVGFAIAALLVALLGLLLAPLAPVAVVSMEAGVVVAFLGGLGRRQSARAEAQRRELLESRAEMREEQARVDLLAGRQQIAHDIHDVLAHSLGGLVIQLDAVEALLESGDAVAARKKVADARALAADGLGDARRAVTALRESTDDIRPVVDASVLIVAIEALLDAHRSLGGVVEFVETGTRLSLGAPLELALRRALQEALTNARRHAAGQPVRVALDWRGHTVSLAVSNPAPVELAAPARTQSEPDGAVGGGNGLAGMRERFAQLAGGVATAGRTGDVFETRVQGDTA